MTRLTLVALSIVAFLLSPAVVTAGIIGTGSMAGEQFYALGGPVTIYFLSSSASYDSRLWVDLPTVIGPMLGNHTSTPGESYGIGPVSHGTVVPLRLEVLQTGWNWMAGPASGNPDHVVHAAISPWVADQLIPVNGYVVAFEDWFGGGDRDYNDAEYVISGVSTIHNPEPGTLLLLGSALIGLGLLRLRKRSNS